MALGVWQGPRTLRDVSRRRLFAASIGAAGLALVVVGLSPDIVLSALAVLLLGAFAGIAWVTGTTLLGTEVDDAVRGRTFAFVQTAVRVVLVAVVAAGPAARPAGRRPVDHVVGHAGVALLRRRAGDGPRGPARRRRRRASPSAASTTGPASPARRGGRGRPPRRRGPVRRAPPAPRLLPRRRGRRRGRQVDPGRRPCGGGWWPSSATTSSSPASRAAPPWAPRCAGSCSTGTTPRRGRGRCRAPRRCCSPPTAPSTWPPSSSPAWPPGPSCSATATSTPPWPTRAPAATWPPTRSRGCRGGPPTACAPTSPWSSTSTRCWRGPGWTGATGPPGPTGSSRPGAEFHDAVRADVPPARRPSTPAATSSWTRPCRARTSWTLVTPRLRRMLPLSAAQRETWPGGSPPRSGPARSASPPPSSRPASSRCGARSCGRPSRPRRSRSGAGRPSARRPRASCAGTAPQLEEERARAESTAVLPVGTGRAWRRPPGRDGGHRRRRDGRLDGRRRVPTPPRARTGEAPADRLDAVDPLDPCLDPGRRGPGLGRRPGGRGLARPARGVQEAWDEPLDPAVDAWAQGYPDDDDLTRRDRSTRRPRCRPSARARRGDGAAAPCTTAPRCPTASTGRRDGAPDGSGGPADRGRPRPRPDRPARRRAHRCHARTGPAGATGERLGRGRRSGAGGRASSGGPSSGRPSARRWPTPGCSPVRPGPAARWPRGPSPRPCSARAAAAAPARTAGRRSRAATPTSPCSPPTRCSCARTSSSTWSAGRPSRPPAAAGSWWWSRTPTGCATSPPTCCSRRSRSRRRTRSGCCARRSPRTCCPRSAAAAAWSPSACPAPTPWPGCSSSATA